MNNSLENARRLSVRNKIKIVFVVALVIIVLFGIATVGFFAYISPPKDNIDFFDYPPEFFCKTEENRIDYQLDGKCAAYAAAYLMRHFGEEANGEELFPELERPFGFVSANSIADVFEKHGYQAKACHGSVDALKQRLTEGKPIIVFIRIPGDTHYAVVVGYDEQYIYLADSLAKNANASDAQYNRVLSTEDFEDIWKTGTPLPDNIYIVVNSAKNYEDKRDIELYYREKGSGEPLILLYGNGEDGTYFENQIEHFQNRYRVIAPDARGKIYVRRKTI